MLYVTLIGHWFDTVVLNVDTPTENKSDPAEGSFYEELQHVCDQFPKYHMKILVGAFCAKVGREDVFEPTFGNEILHEITNDSGVRVVKFTIKKIKLPRVQCSHITTFINTLGLLSMGKHRVI
jgi:hypothetical protein